MAAAAPAAVIEEEEEEAEEGEDDEEYYRRLAWISSTSRRARPRRRSSSAGTRRRFLQEEIEDEAALDDRRRSARRGGDGGRDAGGAAGRGGARRRALAEPSAQLAAAGEVYQKWEEVMANWLKGNFSQSAGFNRDIYAERYFAPGCTLDLSETTLARVYTGPEGASDWLEYKEDFDFGPRPSTASAAPSRRRCTRSCRAAATARGRSARDGPRLRRQAVGGRRLVARAAARLAADSRRRSSATAGGTLYRC